MGWNYAISVVDREKLSPELQLLIDNGQRIFEWLQYEDCQLGEHYGEEIADVSKYTNLGRFTNDELLTKYSNSRFNRSMRNPNMDFTVLGRPSDIVYFVNRELREFQVPSEVVLKPDLSNIEYVAEEVQKRLNEMEHDGKTKEAYYDFYDTKCLVMCLTDWNWDIILTDCKNNKSYIAFYKSY